MKRDRVVFIEDWIWRLARESGMNISKTISKHLINLTQKKKGLDLAFSNCYLCKKHYNKEDLLLIQSFVDKNFYLCTTFVCKTCLEQYKFVKLNKKVSFWEGKANNEIENNIMEACKREYKGIATLNLVPYSLGVISTYNSNSDSFNAIKKSGEWLYLLLSNNNTLISSEKGLLKFKTTDFNNIELNKATPYEKGREGVIN